MKIIFDCTTLADCNDHPTGIQRVVIETGMRLTSMLPSAFLGLFDAAGACFEYDLTRRMRGKKIEVNQGDLIVTTGSNWDQLDHHKRLLSFKKNGVRIATLFHDIIPIILPYSFGPGFSEIYERWFCEALACSDLVFANSENTRKDIINYARENQLKYPHIYVVRLGDKLPNSTEPPAHWVLEKTTTPYILSVGTLEYRKNHILLLNAYRYMVDVLKYEPPRLLIVGKRGWLDHDIEYQVVNDPRLLDRVFILQDISDGDLQYLYQETLFTVYPSHYEGWGLPIAESLCFGKPCIASGTSSMTEIAPGLVNHAHPLRLDEWVDAIREFTENPEKLKQATEKIKADYKSTNWDVTASTIANVLTNQFPELLVIDDMNLYFDYSTVFNWHGNMTGIPRTVHSLATSMHKLYPGVQFVTIDDKLGCFHLLKGEINNFTIANPVKFEDGDVLFSAGAFWSSAEYLDQIHNIKSLGVKYYQVFYDLIPTMFPYFFEKGILFGKYYENCIRECLNLCDGSFSISSCTKNDMVTFLDISEDRAQSIKVIRLGEDFPNSKKSKVTRFGKGGDFLLSVSSLELRKNQMCLLNAYRLLVQRYGRELPKLFLVGREGWLNGDINFQISNDRDLQGLVEVLTDVDDTELHWLYENCLFSLYPSFYEGWGLPIAESLKSGRPCISSGVSSMLEIAPELTIFASPYAAEEWAAAISYYIYHPDKLRKLTNSIKNRYIPTTWASTSASIFKEINIQKNVLSISP